MSAVTDTYIITRRQLQLLTRVPEVLIFSTIQPIMFVLLFRYVFGGSIQTGQPGGYVQLLMPGIFVQTVAFTLAGTASGLAEDMKKGLIDRFRSLPISQSALVVGRTLGDSLLNIVVLTAMGLTGFQMMVAMFSWASYSCLDLDMRSRGLALSWDFLPKISALYKT